MLVNPFDSDAVKLRLYDRRGYEHTPEFHGEYGPCNGIEGLNGKLKQNTPLRRLRCRGQTVVHIAIYMIRAMYNIMQYVRYYRKTGKNFTDGALAAVFSPLVTIFSTISGFFRHRMTDFSSFPIFSRPHPSY